MIVKSVKKTMAVLLGLLLLTLTGCGMSGAPKGEAIESDETYRVTKHEVNGTHFYDVIRRDREGKRPIVFFLHGLNGSKEEMYSYAKMLADTGYGVVVPDIAGHGESTSEETLNFFEMIQSTALSCGDILAFYQENQDMDGSRFSIAGISLGGMTGLYYGAYSEIKPESIVSICGTPDWSSLVNSDDIYIQCKGGKITAVQDETEREAVMALMLQMSPDNNIEYLLQTPILMINGDADPIIPVESIKEFETKAGLFDSHLKCVIEEGRGHDVGSEDAKMMTEFFQEFMPLQGSIQE